MANVKELEDLEDTMEHKRSRKLTEKGREQKLQRCISLRQKQNERGSEFKACGRGDGK